MQWVVASCFRIKNGRYNLYPNTLYLRPIAKIVQVWPDMGALQNASMARLDCLLEFNAIRKLFHFLEIKERKQHFQNG